ncbi:MAG: hypothetical protein AB8H80_06190 [Planctomycetota bacterium]
MTVPLVVFLVLVAAVLAFGILTRAPALELSQAVAVLSDGDLDGDERKALLRRLLRQCEEEAGEFASRVGVSAAMALGDETAFRSFEQRAAGFPSAKEGAAAVDSESLVVLGLGDPLVLNVQRALHAEQYGNKGDAAVVWRQVLAQSRLTGAVFAGAEARRRLGE